jgi:hypothetical protein
MDFEGKRVYIITPYTNPNSSYKRHIPNAEGKPLCKADSRTHGTYEYTSEQSNCKRCVKKSVEKS